MSSPGWQLAGRANRLRRLSVPLGACIALLGDQAGELSPGRWLGQEVLGRPENRGKPPRSEPLFGQREDSWVRGIPACSWLAVGHAKLKGWVKDKSHCPWHCFKQSRAALDPSCLQFLPRHHSTSLSPSSVWRLEVTPEPGPVPPPGCCLGRALEAPGDLGDILCAASQALPGLPELCSGTTCSTADLILINRLIV